MRNRTKALAVGVVAASVIVALTGATRAAPGARAAAPPGAPTAAGATMDGSTLVRMVTLITGDRVTVSTHAGVDTLMRVERGAGRAHVSFGVVHADGHLRVIPSDALPLLRADRVDPRLFDVTGLLASGYDDRRADLPLILTGGQPTTVRAMTRSAEGAADTRSVPGGVAVHRAKATVGSLWRDLASTGPQRLVAAPKVWLDGIRRPTLDQSVPQIGAPTAWAAGYTGTGVTVGVVDTGIDSSHPDLTGQVIAAQDFTGTGDTRDYVGHGTHVAATIASHDTRYRGVAFGAHLVSAKVCAEDGCTESAILAGMQWAAQQGAKVINMSLGGGDSPGIDPLEAAVADLTARYGVLFVIAAGNDGNDSSIESPGSADDALTVGAVTKQDELAGFSSRGPRTGDEAIKPDITAPGVDIVAACSADSDLCALGATHVSLSGTSMATPHVAGSAALLIQEHPTWTPAQVKAALMGSALRNPTLGVFAQGAGRVDVAHEITEEVLAEPASESFGKAVWPHDDDLPVTRTLIYRNMSTSDVTLQLSMVGDAPAGMFTLSADSVIVPAQGTASVTLTSDTRLDVPDALYTGYVVARGGDTSVSTPYAVDKAPEQHTVTLHYRDRAGRPSDNVFSLLMDPVSGAFFEADGDDATVEVPAGTYVLLSDVFEDSGDVTNLDDPVFTVDRDRTVTVDARRGRQVSVTVPFAGAQEQVLLAGADVDGLTVLAYATDPATRVFTGTLHPGATSTHFHGIVNAQYLAPPAAGTDSPALVQVAWHLSGHMFVGLTERLRRADLAAVHATQAYEGVSTGLFGTRPVWPDWASPLFPVSPVDLPSTRVEYLNGDGGLRWERELAEFDDSGNETNLLVAPLTALKAGRDYHEARNVAVLSQGFAPPLFGTPLFARRGDLLVLGPTVNDRLNWTELGAVPPTSTQLTLDRDGVRVLDANAGSPVGVDVDPGAADYRLGVTVTRGAPDTLSTSATYVWTFRSDTTAAGHYTALPMSVVRFLPKLDLRNTGSAGRTVRVPVEVIRQPGSAAARMRTLTVEVSVDDGATWHAVPVRNGAAVLTNPASGFVSLRATEVDLAGDTVSETVIRAYRVG